MSQTKDEDAPVGVRLREIEEDKLKAELDCTDADYNRREDERIELDAEKRKLVNEAGARMVERVNEINAAHADELKAQAIDQAVINIIETVLEDTHPRCDGCRMCAESGDCYVELSKKPPQEWKKMPSGLRYWMPTGAPSDYTKVKLAVGEKFLALLKRLAEISEEGD